MLKKDKISYRYEILDEHLLMYAFLEEKEVGFIELKQIDDYLQIENFCVKENLRNQKIGYHLLKKAKKVGKWCGFHKMKVFPMSDPYPGDSYINDKDLYIIYQKLGFVFKNENPDLNIANEEMNLVF